MAIRPVKLACVDMKSAGKIMGVSVEVVEAYAEQDKLQRISVGSDRMIPLYEIADLRDVTLKEVMYLARKYSLIVCCVWIEVTATNIMCP